jgi:hypothetical protein
VYLRQLAKKVRTSVICYFCAIFLPTFFSCVWGRFLPKGVGETPQKPIKNLKPYQNIFTHKPSGKRGFNRLQTKTKKRVAPPLNPK